jgi:Carboxypeptidase regulatory-like domain
VTPLILFALLLQAPQTYTIGGTVEDSVTGAPVARTRVIIAGAITAMGTPAAARTVIAGAHGRFRFDGPRVQKYILTAERPGYATQAFGQRALYQQFSTAIMTGEGQATDNLVFRLIPSAVITVR